MFLLYRKACRTIWMSSGISETRATFQGRLADYAGDLAEMPEIPNREEATSSPWCISGLS
jgi:hypothetical protein